jgi:hypothetical protein
MVNVWLLCGADSVPWAHKELKREEEKRDWEKRDDNFRIKFWIKMSRYLVM